MKLTAEQVIQKNTLMVITHPKYRSLGGVVMMGSTSVDDDFPTAYVDGYNTVYGRAFILGLAEPEVRFVILHETLHKALRHLTTWRWMWEEDPALANQACDYVINLLLVLSDAGEGFILMPKSGLLDHKYANLDAGDVYRLLKQDKQNGKGKASGAQGFDAHGWEEAKALSEAEADKRNEEVIKAMKQGGVLAGKAAGDITRALDEANNPRVPWQEALREFLMSHAKGKDMSTWRRPNRRYIDSGLYLPASYSESMGRIVVGPDTSGSIQGKILTAFLSEVAAIGRVIVPESMDLLYWDTHVASHERYAPGQYDALPKSTKPKGGGGTRPSCVSEYLHDKRIKPECIVMLTDGHVGSDWGHDWNAPVVWCVINNKNAKPAMGKVVHIGVK